MKLKFLFLAFLSLTLLRPYAQTRSLSRQQVEADLDSVLHFLRDHSSYVYLNGYAPDTDIARYREALTDAVRLDDFGLFLTGVIGKIGDRHASVRGHELKDSLYLPFVYAPVGDKVSLLTRRADKSLALLYPQYPYVRSIDGYPIADFLRGILPEEATAPVDAYFTEAVRELRDVQKNYRVLGKPLPELLRLTLSDASRQRDTVLLLPTVPRKDASRPWDDKLEGAYVLMKDEDYNKPEVIDELFAVRDSVAYIRLPAMVGREDAPRLFDRMDAFMHAVRHDTKGLIIDVRGNGGGTRDLTYAAAKYLVHPDSIYVVNATRQRGPLPLSGDDVQSLNDRQLFAFAALDPREQDCVRTFLRTFKPMYALDDTKYSEFYFGLLNGGKLAKGAFYYGKPVYILANEKSFSAASVFVAVLKGLPHVRVAGVPTDGSSGNSERFELRHSGIRLKLSTMVSFQKDGLILDGMGTYPDIELPRDMEQVLGHRDSQLEEVMRIILRKGDSR